MLAFASLSVQYFHTTLCRRGRPCRVVREYAQYPRVQFCTVTQHCAREEGTPKVKYSLVQSFTVLCTFVQISNPKPHFVSPQPTSQFAVLYQFSTLFSRSNTHQFMLRKTSPPCFFHVHLAFTALTAFPSVRSAVFRPFFLERMFLV